MDLPPGRPGRAPLGISIEQSTRIRRGGSKLLPLAKCCQSRPFLAEVLLRQMRDDRATRLRRSCSSPMVPVSPGRASGGLPGVEPLRYGNGSMEFRASRRATGLRLLRYRNGSLDFRCPALHSSLCTNFSFIQVCSLKARRAVSAFSSLLTSCDAPVHPPPSAPVRWWASRSCPYPPQQR